MILFQRRATRLAMLAFGLVAFLSADPSLFAQNNNNNNNNGGFGGIAVDANGVVSRAPLQVRSTGLAIKRQKSYASENLSQDIAQPSESRKVSLVQLETKLKEIVEAGKPVPDDVFFMAGLQRIDYIFVYPEKNDLVIAGPAGSFGPDIEGRMVGLESGRPPLRIDDFVIAFQSIRSGNDVSCSIDPIPSNMSAMQNYIRQNSSPTSPAGAKARYRNMGKILGVQNVTVRGVPLDTHFAQTLVEADYRMKRLSMGLEGVRVKGFRSHLSMLQPGGNSVQRWWFTPLYDAFYTTENRNAFELAGQRAQLSSQEEIVDGQGNRSSAAMTRVSTHAWSKLFTEKFPEIAKASPVFAELQNMIDLLIVAALIENQQLARQTNWQQSFLASRSEMPFPKGNPPKHVQSLVNIKPARRGVILGLIGGGVTINASNVVRKVSMKVAPERRLSGIRSQSQPRPDADEEKIVWWWD